jgi:hypothetical protein
MELIKNNLKIGAKIIKKCWKLYENKFQISKTKLRKKTSSFLN